MAVFRFNFYNFAFFSEKLSLFVPLFLVLFAVGVWITEAGVKGRGTCEGFFFLYADSTGDHRID